MKFKIIVAESSTWLTEVYAVRKMVFVNEQGIPEADEIDDCEKSSRHFLALDTTSSKGVGAARWRITDTGIKLERFCVLPDYRRHGAGTALLHAVLDDIRLHTDTLESIYLHAQLSALPFYRSRGFREKGKVFMECGIEHCSMVLAD